MLLELLVKMGPENDLLRLLSKIYEPTSGEIEINGKIRSLLSLGAGLEITLTGRENIKRLLYLYGESQWKPRSRNKNFPV